jgi:uracil-DNA glycosylase
VPSDSLDRLAAEIIECRKCPRLVRYREAVARAKRPAFRDWTYWGRPVPGFGDPSARLLIVGLAPAAHGGNRTGRVFTGDRSGDWLYRALFRSGFASQPTAVSRDDGLTLTDCYIAAAVRCAPPGNRPTKSEFTRCQPYLEREIGLLASLRVVVALGGVGMRAFLRAWRRNGHELPAPMPRFAHRGSWSLPPITLMTSYHPSQRNTQTGLLTESMFDSIFEAARRRLSEDTNVGNGGRKDINLVQG